MRVALRRLLEISFLLACASAQALAQTPAAQSAPVKTMNLSEFEGLYEYRDENTLFIVASGDRLIAIIGEAKYPLRAAGTDAFTNAGGDRIPFLRDASGRIVALKEGSDTYRRLSTSVPSAARLLLEARAKGRDGRPVVYRYEKPARVSDGIRVEAAGPGTISPEAAARLVNGVLDGTYPDIRSILVCHRGALRLEEYFYGYDRDRPHQMRSLTKSVISLLAGAAIDRGLLRADEPILGKLGYTAYENPDPRKARVTMTDLLSNVSGFACNDYDRASPGNETKLYETPDWVKAFIDLPLAAEPGTIGRYCSAGFFTVGRIVERAAGKSLPDFAQEALFGPLGIERAGWKWVFKLDRSQRNEFGQIYLRPRDMLKLGILIEQRGMWKGNRILSASWIEKMIARQSRIDDSDYGLGLWHRWYRVQTPAGDRRVDTIMLSGNGGQKVYLVPTLDLIVVLTGGAFNAESPANEVMARLLLPALIAR